MQPFLVFLAIALVSVAFVCELCIFWIQRSIAGVERKILERYRSKIDKIPSLIEVIRSHSDHPKAVTELLELHRHSIASATDRIYDVLEFNAHITDRFSFLMRLSMQIRTTIKDGNFITIRESILALEGAIRELLLEHARLTRLLNGFVRARDLTFIGKILPGGKMPVIARY